MSSTATSDLATARRLSVAPMIDWTTRHCRYFHRLLAPRALLYTEMITTGALIHGDAGRHLQHDQREHPIALQLGGSDPDDLAKACKIAATYGYDEFNLNVGCPSDRVQKGSFGACLMAEPALVRECCAAMIEAGNVPVTVKCRIGIDQSEDYTFLRQFVDEVASAGIDTFIIHARKAWLTGLSPKQNREIPPLRYDIVYRLKADRPDLTIIMNGGITSTSQALMHRSFTDGVMIGRQAYQEPASLPLFHSTIFNEPNTIDEWQALAEFARYTDAQLALGVPFRAMARHVLGLFNGRPGARHFRRTLSEGMGRDDAGSWLFEAATAPLQKAA